MATYTYSTTTNTINTGNWTYRYVPTNTTTASWIDCSGCYSWKIPAKEKEINIDEDSLLKLLQEEEINA